MPTRRLLLAVSALVLSRASVRGADLFEEPVEPLGGIVVPAERARVLAAAALGGTAAVLIAFGADTAAGQRDLLAVAAGGVLVALEPLVWRGTEGSRLGTRVTFVPDGQRLRLQRIGTVPRGQGYHREDWTDYLAWNNGAPMHDAPARPVLAGTWQAVLSEQRAGMRALLGVGLHGVPAALIAACPAPVPPAA